MSQPIGLPETPLAEHPGLTRLTLILLGLMVSIPFLHPVHHEPMPSFYEEWWALLLGLMATIGLVLARPRHFVLPSLLAVPGLLLAAVVLQWFGGAVRQWEFALFHGGYLAWAAMIMVLSATLARQVGRAALSEALALALLTGAAINALLALAQFFQLHLPPHILLPSAGRPLGNLAQPNLLSTHLWMGIAAAIYLYERQRIPIAAALFAVMLLGAVAGLTGSRTGLLEGAMLLLLTLGIAATTGRKPGRRSLLLALALLALLAAPLAPRPAATGGGPTPDATTVTRLASALVSGDARLDLWRDTLTMIGDHPWVGNGVGNFAWRMVEAASRAPEGAATLPGAEHAHNALLQLAADFGLPLAGLCMLFGAVWLLRLTRSADMATDRWSIDVLIILAIHSLLEYPLWYANFLGVFCLAAGALDARTSVIAMPRRRILLPLALGMALVALLPLRIDYLALDDASHRRPLQPSQDDWRRRIDTVAGIAKTSALAPYAYVALGSLLEPDRRLAPQQSAICERAMLVWPDPVIIARCAWLRGLTGREDAALELLRTARAAFRDPRRRAALREALQQAQEKSPDKRLSGLLSD